MKVLYWEYTWSEIHRYYRFQHHFYTLVLFMSLLNRIFFIFDHAWGLKIWSVEKMLKIDRTGSKKIKNKAYKCKQFWNLIEINNHQYINFWFIKTKGKMRKIISLILIIIVIITTIYFTSRTACNPSIKLKIQLVLLQKMLTPSRRNAFDLFY